MMLSKKRKQDKDEREYTVNRKRIFSPANAEFGTSILFACLTLGALVFNLATASTTIATLVLPIAVVWGIIELFRQFEIKWTACIGICTCWIIVYEILLFSAILLLYLEGMPSISSSPCGRSSCSKISKNTDPVPIVAYHPAGRFNSLYPFYMFCPRLPGECRWGDHTVNAAPLGYPGQPDEPLLPDTTQTSCNARTGSPTSLGDNTPPPCPFLATQRAEDYPDLGYGLRDGYYPGVTATLVKPCPLIDLGNQGKGVDVCGYCSHYLHRHYNLPLPTKGCPSPDEVDGHCAICHDVTMRQNDSHRLANVVLFGLICVASPILAVLRMLHNTHQGYTSLN